MIDAKARTDTGSRQANTPEQRARDLLERMGWDAAQGLSSGEVVEIAQLIAEVEELRKLARTSEPWRAEATRLYRMGEDVAEARSRARIEVLEEVLHAAESTLLQQRREFARGDIGDLDALEDAIEAAGGITMKEAGKQ